MYFSDEDVSASEEEDQLQTDDIASKLLVTAAACRAAGATAAVQALVKLLGAALAGLANSDATAAEDDGLAGFVCSLGLQPEVSGPATTVEATASIGLSEAVNES
eukprot:gene10182-10342_t